MTPRPPIRVVLADDHPLVLDGLERLFDLESDFEVIARCRDGLETVEAMRTRRPDLVVLDLRMPGLDGLAILALARREKLRGKVLLLTAAIDTQQIGEAVRLGAHGLVLKEMAPELVIAAARQVQAGKDWFDPGLLARAVESLSRELDRGASGEELTPRERKIVGMVAQGLRNRAIASELGISEGTVKLHLHHVYEKLQLSGRFELLLHAQKHGF